MRYFRFLFLFVALLLTACQNLSQSDWREIDKGLERAVFQYESHNSQKQLVVYKIDQTHFRFEVKQESKAKKLEDWLTDDALMVINGGYFHEDNSPSGLIISNSEVKSTRQFDYDKSGLVSVKDNTFSIIDLSTVSEIDLDSFDHAIQSYPFFIKEGQKSIKEDSERIARRTVIATDREGFVYIIMVPSSDLSLYQLMEVLHDMPIDFQYALNLDGGTSTGLVTDINGYQEKIYEMARVPNVLIVKRKVDKE